MRISDWSSDVCSSDLKDDLRRFDPMLRGQHALEVAAERIGIAVRFAQRRRGSLQRTRAWVVRVLVRSQLDQARRSIAPPQRHQVMQIGRASCRESVCQYVKISGGAVSLKKKTR